MSVLVALLVNDLEYNSDNNMSIKCTRADGFDQLIVSIVVVYCNKGGGEEDRTWPIWFPFRNFRFPLLFFLYYFFIVITLLTWLIIGAGQGKSSFRTPFLLYETSIILMFYAKAFSKDYFLCNFFFALLTLSFDSTFLLLTFI